MKRMIMDGNMENGAQAPAEEAREKQVTAKEELVRENSVQAEQGGNDPADRYAHMFADWDLLPPQVLIRRVSRK